ncbi:hypothetical protein C8R46DRAFT_1210590 [Mycena filopes]|nr:hypothetical protein C8R46DRAFT_1210590 [Mycena filopes]
MSLQATVMRLQFLILPPLARLSGPAVPLTFHRSSRLDLDPWSTAWETNDQQPFFQIDDES